jgi:septum formation protein
MLVLASSSPSRLQVLQKLGIEPSLQESPDIDESHKKGESPRELSLRLSREKGAKIAVKYPNDLVISADTVVCIGRKIIDKCESNEDVIKAMQMLSGKNHKIFTSVCVTMNNKQKFRTVETRVKFKVLTDQEIANFALTNEGIGKAGGYTITGVAEKFIQKINGSVSAVIGLPTYETINLLRSCGVLV